MTPAELSELRTTCESFQVVRPGVEIAWLQRLVDGCLALLDERVEARRALTELADQYERIVLGQPTSPAYLQARKALALLPEVKS